MDDTYIELDAKLIGNAIPMQNILETIYKFCYAIFGIGNFTCYHSLINSGIDLELLALYCALTF